MGFFKTLLAGAVGTTIMTLYSYGYSYFKESQFREPVLLAHLLKGREKPECRQDYLQGWLAHYLVGAVFSTSYQALFKGRLTRNPRLKGVVAGGFYGLLGVAGWKSTFKLHPAPPKIKYNEYYRHLVIAHLIFGYFAFGMLEKEKNEKGAVSKVQS